MSDRLKEIAEELDAIGRVLEVTLAQRKKLRQESAEIKCPYRIGDRLTRIYGTGQRVDRVEVSAIRWSDWRDGYRIIAKKIKKDGGLYMQDSELFSAESWKLEKVK